MLAADDTPWALIISAFINKSGEIAMSLLPMLLIEKNVSSGGASLILGFTKAAQLTGFFIGGFLTDLLGFRLIILTAYFVGFLGFTTLPFLNSKYLIAIFSALAQFGSALFAPSARAMLRYSNPGNIKKNLAWLRTASNLGQVVSSTLSIAIGPLGLVVPFIVDGTTSLGAFLIGTFTLKNPAKTDAPEVSGSVQKGYFLFSMALAFYFFVYELGFLSFSGFGKIALGNDGIRAFGVVLLVNTFLCGSLAVPAANLFQQPRQSLYLGFSIMTLGMLLLTLLPKTTLNFAVCSLIMTTGEIAFGVFSQSLLLVNSSGQSSKHYGLSLMIQATGRLGAGVALFPLVLRSTRPYLPFVIAPILFFVMMSLVPREFIKRGEPSQG